MSPHQPTRSLHQVVGNSHLLRIRVATVWFAAVALTSSVYGQYDRQEYLTAEPVATAAVQSLATAETPSYDPRNVVMMYRPEAEDPLSYYARTQDGEWQVPAHVDPNDPWVRVLVLTSPRPALIDFAVLVNGKPFRHVRESWIDQLQEEAKAVVLVRSGVEAADAMAAKLAASKESAEGDAEVSSDAPDDSESDIPMTAAKSREAQTASRQLINYLAANHRTIDRQEVRWLLADQTGGPTLLTLGPAQAWRRASLAPLWHALDQDEDDVLSAEEIENVTALFQRADINQDDNIDLNELTRLKKKQHVSSRRSTNHPIAVVIDAETDWKSLKKHLARTYPEQDEQEHNEALLARIRRGDRSLQAADLVNLIAVAPDFVCRVAFGEQPTALTLFPVDEAASDEWQFVSATNDVVTVEQSSTYLELTAAEPNYGDEAITMQQTQIAVGAVDDGFPLFRLVDRDNNRHLTLREQRRVGELLRGLDRSGDGRLDPHEIPTAIRLAVTRGPLVHEHLAQATAAQKTVVGENTTPAPAWFVGMDTNRDGDISRREFKGSSSQFAKFDQDQDGLISKKEAQ